MVLSQGAQLFKLPAYTYCVNPRIYILTPLAQAPEEDYFSVHIRIVGDWSADVARLMGAGQGEFQQSWELPK